MLNCKEISERASEFIDGNLPWYERLEVRLHLMMCRFCREYVRQMALVVRSLRRLGKFEPAAEPDPDLLALFRTTHP